MNILEKKPRLPAPPTSHSLKIKFPIIGLLLLSACQPPRAPIKRPLEIEGKPRPVMKVPSNDLVRIGVRVETSQVKISNLASIDTVDLLQDDQQNWPPGEYVFSAKSGFLMLDGQKKGKKWRFHSSNPDRQLQVGDKGYRGDLVVRVAGDDKLTVVNELSIDDYLKGVLPREVVVTWAEQSLRAQAVAARTYLASHLGAHASQGFDLCSDVHCQVYGGTAKEHPRTNDAVDDTRDQILIYEGKPIGAYFYSHCGGSTEQIQAVWGETNKPYLPRKKCSYCVGNPRYSWTLSLSMGEILSGLRAKTLVRGEKLKSLRIKKKSGSGRAEYITVTTDKGSYDLRGNAFRIALNPEKIRSTLFTKFEKHGNGYKFAGRGWGHGVGFCQWGAKGQAEAGKGYREILRFYYPGAELVTWSR